MATSRTSKHRRSKATFNTHSPMRVTLFLYKRYHAAEWNDGDAKMCAKDDRWDGGGIAVAVIGWFWDMHLWLLDMDIFGYE